ncbi:transporter [Arthrobacter sp. MN05-02]|nr:transporter [Arthrobacter sp. MN05-02]
MGRIAVLALRVVLCLMFAGSVVIQVVMLSLLGIDLDGADPDVALIRTPLVVLTVLGILALQVAVVCVWGLLTMVRRGTVFSPDAFRLVNIVIGAFAAASLLAVGLGIALAPGEAVAPGVVLLIGGVAVMIAAVALIVLVLRALLAQAVARDTEARQLRIELDEVI